MYVEWLISGVKVYSEIQNISLSSKQLPSVLAAPAVYSDLRKGHVWSALMEHGTNQCALPRVHAWAKVSRVWYYTHTILHCY